MSYLVRLRAEAEQDIAAAALWYEQQRYELGQEFLDEILAIRLRLSETPPMYPIVRRNTHRAITNRFPFGVYFRVEDSQS